MWRRSSGHAAVTSILRSPIVHNVAIGLILTICSRRIKSLSPPAGYDPSWRAGLAMAFNQHLSWGSAIEFTYGPLGFLATPLRYFALTTTLAFCYQVAVGVVLFGLLVCVLRKNFPLVIAIIVSFAIGTTVLTDVEGILGANDILIGFAAIIGLLALDDDKGPRRAHLVALGVLCGVATLVKFSDGIAAFGVLVVVTVTNRNWRRDTSIGIGAFVASFVISWVATGNSLTNIAGYFGNSFAITAGYAGAEVLGQTTLAQRFEIAAFLLVVCALGFDGLRGEGSRRMTGTILILAGFCWISLREAFVREDAAHAQVFFALVLLVVPVLHMKPGRTPALFAAIVLCCGLCWANLGEIPSGIRNPVTNARSFINQSSLLADAPKLDNTITAARSHLKRVLGVPENMLDALEHQSVAIEPWENDVAWAYSGFRWDPEPVLQSSNAYTTSLDELDASFLYSRRAPTRILQSPPEAIDNQYAFFEAPATQVAQICRYEQIVENARWQVLRRVGDRCGPIYKLTTVVGHVGAFISVPKAKPNTVVLASFGGIASSLAYRVEQLAFRPPVISVELSANGFTRTYRLVPGTASDLCVMDAPRTLGYAPRYAPRNITSLEIVNPNSGDGSYTVTFYAMAMSEPQGQLIDGAQ